jgi:hypothetical protein
MTNCHIAVMPLAFKALDNNGDGIRLKDLTGDLVLCASTGRGADLAGGVVETILP